MKKGQVEAKKRYLNFILGFDDGNTNTCKYKCSVYKSRQCDGSFSFWNNTDKCKNYNAIN